jgi:hypothetical protein
MAQQTELKVVLSDGTEDVLTVGDKVKYSVFSDFRSVQSVYKVVRLTATRAYLENDGWVTNRGQVQGVNKRATYRGKYTRVDELNDLLMRDKRELGGAVSDLTVKDRYARLREPKDNVKAEIDGLKAVLEKAEQMIARYQELEELLLEGNK